MTPGDAAQMQMAQQMQDFMQMQMQFMQMMTANGGRPHSQHGGPPQMPMMPPMGTMPPPPQRPGSMHGRAMSMLDPNAAPWQPQPLQNRTTIYAPSVLGGGYTPSIAPSERSNVGMPGRYRPVSHHPGAENKSSRTSTMPGTLENWTSVEAKQPPTTIKLVKKGGGSGNASDEDEEEGWEAMKAKREKKKSIWRSKKGDEGSSGNQLKDLWSFAAS
jgi:hypothetical protein